MGPDSPSSTCSLGPQESPRDSDRPAFECSVASITTQTPAATYGLNFPEAQTIVGDVRVPKVHDSILDLAHSTEESSQCRWHYNRHTLVTELAESGGGDEVIMSIAGYVSRAMLSRYSHVRLKAKRRALDEIAASVRPTRSGGKKPNRRSRL